MRVTNKLMADTVVNNLFKNTERLLRTQTMISSGKRINRPSDDPMGMSQVLGYRKTVSSIDQYEKNINHGVSWLGISDSALETVDSLLIRAKELAVNQATDTATAETRLIAAEEVKNLYDQIMQLANSKSGNSYIFAGHKTDTSPYSRDNNFNATYNGDDGDIRIIIGENVEISINGKGIDIFGSGPGSAVDIFDILRDLNDGMEINDPDAIAAQIDLLSDCLDQVLKARADVGAELNRLESTANYWGEFKLNVTKMLSETEDADFTKAVTELATQEAIYEASLGATSMMIQPTLINFLM
ncbi:MAG: flagellar hook-associated protein FlgL [Thermodesulfobacteriota bacterium]|nr:flagellar hook-associated protein FlgL [Thermodesulfobacteriota bacterium]